jgi:cytochrome c biogenesis protein CcdA
MITGLVFVLAGIMIALYPQLLSLIVASILIFAGIALIFMGYHARRISRKFGDPFVDYFFWKS